MLCRAFTTFSGTLTSGTGIPTVKPELSLDLSWSCLISFDRVQASCGCPRRSCSSISAIAGPDCQLSVRCSDAATFDGDRCSFRLSLAFMFALAVLPSLMFKIFSAAFLVLWCWCFFVHYSSSGTECFTVLRCETDGMHCEGNYLNVEAELRAGRRAFCRSGTCFFPNERYVSGERSACFSFLSRLFFGIRSIYGLRVSRERCSQPAAYDQAANMHEPTDQLPCRFLRLSWKAIWSAETAQRSVVAFAIVSVQLANNSERVLLNNNVSWALPTFVQVWRSKKKTLWKRNDRDSGADLLGLATSGVV